VTDEPINPELDRLFALLAEEENGKADPVEHPSAATLSAYHARTLPSDEVAQVQEHLTACGQCREQLLEYAQFMASPAEEPADNVSSLKKAAEWRRLRSSLYSSKRRLTYAMAAVLFMAVVGLSIYTLSSGPERSKTLEPLDSDRGRPGAAEAVQLPVTLLLKSPAKSPYPEYRADLWSGSGRHIRGISRLKQSPSFDVKIHLKEDDLAPGDYRIELQGIRKGTRFPVGKYVFRVVDR
jgi:hypothetical protein